MLARGGPSHAALLIRHSASPAKPTPPRRPQDSLSLHKAVIEAFPFSGFPRSAPDRDRHGDGPHGGPGGEEAMSPFPYLLAVALLSSPHEGLETRFTPEVVAKLQPALQSLAVEWEILDPREVRYV